MNKFNKKLSENNNETDELLGILELLANEYIKKGISFKQVCGMLKSAMISASRKQGNINKTEIALSTGIDRREIHKDTRLNNIKSNKLIDIISELRFHKINKKNIIDIKGGYPSLQYFSKILSGRITLPTIIKELTKKKIIKVIDKNIAMIINTRISTVDTDFERYRLINQQICKQFATITHNYETPEDKWLDYGVSSTKINKSNQHKLNRVFRQYFNFFRPKLVDLLERFESNVSANYYEKYSFNFFINIKNDQIVNNCD